MIERTDQNENAADHVDRRSIAKARRTGMVRLALLWWSRAELKRTLCRVIFYRIDCGLYRDLNCIFIAGEAEHQPQVIVVNIHRDQECVK